MSRPDRVVKSFIVEAGFIAWVERQSRAVLAVFLPGRPGSNSITEMLIASLGI